MRSIFRVTAVLGALAFVITSGITGCDDSNNAPLASGVDSVTVFPTSIVVLKIGDTAHFSASVHGGPGLTNRAVTWSSNDSAIATVDQSGVATAVAPGTTSILATSQANAAISGAAVVTIAPPPPVAPATYTTNFSGTENPLSEGGSWTEGGTVGRDWQNVQKNGFASATTFATGVDDNIAVLATSFGGKQFAQATVKRDVGYSPSNTHEIELLVHFAISANVARGYETYWGYSGNLNVVRWNGAINDFTVLIGRDTNIGAPADGDVLRVEIDNSGVITVYKNGTSQTSVTDTTWTDGQPGIGFFLRTGGTLTALGWKSFTGGNF